MPAFFRRTAVRLAATYTLFFAVVASLAAGGFWVTFQGFEYREIDESLQGQAQLVLTDLGAANDRIALDRPVELPGETLDGIAVPAFIVGPDGRVVEHSAQHPSVIAYPLSRSQVPPGSGLETVNSDGRALRVLVKPVDLEGQGLGALVLVRPLGELQSTLAQTAVLAVAVVFALIAVAAVLAYQLARHAFRPVHLMAAMAREISERDLHRRITLDLPPGDDLAELATTFNSMMARLEQAFDGLRQFTADAAHELRTPLALMRTQVEIVLRRERSAEEYRENDRELLEEVEAMSRTVDQLLLLARADAGSLVPHRELLDLPEFLEEIRERWRPAYAQRKVLLVLDAPAAGKIRADPALLKRLLDNLLDNALRYSPQDEQVTIGAHREATGWLLRISDRGPGVDGRVRDALFERFSRADPARRRETGGAGLGLSLCLAIARAHGGSVTLAESSPEHGSTFVVELPAEAAASVAD